MSENKQGAPGTHKNHKIEINARERLELTGVESVESFDEQSVVLKTVCGTLTVEGEGLHVSTLDMERGVVAVEGHIGGLWYTDTAPQKRGWRGKLFG